MVALLTTVGKIRALELLVADITHVGVGRPDPGWVDEFHPDDPDVNATNLVDTIGYARVTTRGWLSQDNTGDILIDGIIYKKVVGPTTIAYTEATIPSGEAEGITNKIGQIGVFGKDVVTSPALGDWVLNANITSPGTLFRLENIPVFIRPPSTVSTFLVAFPLEV